MKRAAALVVVAAMALMLPACGTVRSTIDVLRAMQAEDYHDISIRFNDNNGFDTVVVRASGGPSEDPVGKAAKIVWTKFKFTFDQIDVRVDGEEQLYSRSELEEQFGPRPAGLDNDLSRDVLRTIGVVAAIAFVFVGVVVLIIVLVVRNSRRKHPPMPPPPPGWYGGPPPPSHWGTPPQQQ